MRLGHGQYCSQSCAYSDETTWHPRWWRIPLENPWKCHFRDSKFQNVARCPDPQEFVPWCEFQSRQLLIIICLLLNTFRQPFSQVQVLDVCTTAVWIPKNIHSYGVLMKLFLTFFPSVALVHKPCRLMGFLLILKESHEGKNVSYVTIAVLLICFRFLNYVDTFTHCPMTAYFLKNLTQLRVYWTTEWKMRLSNWRRLWTRGPWTPTLDRVHGPLSWTGSMHPPVMEGVHGHLFLNNEKWAKTEIVEK